MRRVIGVLSVAAMFCAVFAQDDLVSAPDEFARPSENFIEAEKKNKEGKPIVAVGLFSETDESPFAKQVSEKVEEILKNTERFQMRQELVQIGNGNLVQLGAELGADYIVSGHISKLTPFQNSSGFSASMALTVKLAKVETGEIMQEASISTQRNGVTTTAEKAVDNLLKDSIAPQLITWAAKNFPTKIVELGQQSPGKVKTVYIQGAASYGYKKKDKFDIRIEEEINGEMYHKSIGTLKIKQLEDGRSLAKVKKGKDKITDISKIYCYLQRK